MGNCCNIMAIFIEFRIQLTKEFGIFLGLKNRLLKQTNKEGEREKPSNVKSIRKQLLVCLLTTKRTTNERGGFPL